MVSRRSEPAEQERIEGSSTSAHTQGLSICKIATATTLSSSRVHQLLHTEESSQIPQWLNALRIEEIPVEVAAVDCNSSTESDWQRLLVSEVELTNQRIRWLEQLVGGEKVVVNLRAVPMPDRRLHRASIRHGYCASETNHRRPR